MCHTPVGTRKTNNICIYCGSKNHTSGSCTSRPYDNREELRATPRDLQDHRFGNAGNLNCFPELYKFDQNKSGHQETRFDQRFNRQYSLNYNNFLTSPLGSIPGQDLSATLIDLANIQSRSLELMVASQKNQQEAFHKLARSNKDKANDAMFEAVKVYNGTNRALFEDWIDKLDQACRISGCNFRTKVIKILTGAVCMVVLTNEGCSDDQLINNLISSFSDGPIMNMTREELRSMRQKEKKSVRVYAYRCGHALVRSSGIRPNMRDTPMWLRFYFIFTEKYQE